MLAGVVALRRAVPKEKTQMEGWEEGSFSLTQTLYRLEDDLRNAASPLPQFSLTQTCHNSVTCLWMIKGHADLDAFPELGQAVSKRASALPNKEQTDRSQ